MIPLRLQLKNFLSYGSTIQTINFTHYKLICLSGKNGHGKSALLDAITWSLWGQARKVGGNAKPDAGLLRLGQVEMMVMFDFIFNNQTYRVRRDYSKKYGKPHLHVDFGMLSDDDTFIPLTDKTTRKTQEKIEKTLGLDFDAFINSSFLRQGQANEFSKKSAKERKEVLSNILGLHHYDATKKFILEKTRSKNTEKLHLEKLNERLHEEQEQIKEVPQKLAVVDKELKELINQESRLKERIKTYEQDQKTLTEKEQSKKLLIFEKEQTNKELKEQKEELVSLRTLWKDIQKKLLQVADSKLLESKKQEILQKINEQQLILQKTLQEKSHYLSQKESLTKLIQESEKTFNAKLQSLSLDKERITIQQETTKKEITLNDEKQKEHNKKLEALKKEIETIQKTVSPEALLLEKKELTARFEKHRETYQRWIEQGNWVNNELQNLHKKQNLSQDGNNPSCPLCEQNLSQARKRFLHTKFQGQEKFLNHRFNRLKSFIQKLKNQLKKEHKDLEQITLLDTHKQDISNINNTLKDAREEKTNLAKLLVKLEKQQKSLEIEEEKIRKDHKLSLEQNKEYKELKDKIESFEKENKKQTASDPLPELQKKLKEIEVTLKEQESIKEQKMEQTERTKKMHALCRSLKTISQKLKDLEKALKPFSQLENELRQHAELHAKLKRETEELFKKKEEHLTEKGRLEIQNKKREQLTKEQKDHKKELQELTSNLHEYQIISTALGKDGIQALLIEDALPEIEQEANELLSRLTDNQASIHIESLRDLKSGGTRETLDINISDTNGIRPYELFSGGEAFRIDFALRIAISKLLARRAGTSLQTLIIDEGFGSQDEEGLSRIMDALYTIQDDFEKIIIVSHLSTMKDQFPVHFTIHKDAQGSHVRIVEQG